MSDLEKLRALEALESKPIHVELNGLTAFTVLATIQLATRHPEFLHNSGAKLAVEFARHLEAAIVELAPSLKELCSEGWDPGKDE